VNFHLVNASDSFSASQEYLINAAKWSSIIITRLEMKSSRWSIIESLMSTQVPLSLGSVSPDLNSELVCVSKKDLVNQLDQEFRKALASTVPEASSDRAAA
jgi:isopentenyl phosphate kinase